ncbi:MAG: M3 family metallopeptidase [Bacteroidales bacterium]
MPDNPFFESWTTPHQTPPFPRIALSHYKPAFEAAVRAQKAAVEQIVGLSVPATFLNTLEALENSGALLDKVSSIFFNLNEADTSEEMQDLAQELMPMLTDHGNDIMLNEKLFERVSAVYSALKEVDLPVEERMLLEKTYKQFRRNGANLQGPDRDRYREISRELSSLSLQFGQNVLAETNDFSMHITRREELDGLPETALQAARMAAQEKGLEGWIFTLHQPSRVPFLQYAHNRGLREKIWRAFASRGCRENERNNFDVIRRIVNLRLEKARLLGYKSHAHFVLEERMAENPANVNRFLEQIRVAARPVAEKEYSRVSDYARQKGADFLLQPWDWLYYSEQLKDSLYQINDEQLRPYFSLPGVIKGVFGLAGELFGLTFRENPEIPVYHNDVQVFEVFCGEEFMAVLYLDFYPRESKRGGAWMTSFRETSQEGAVSVRPLVSLVCNFTKPTPNTPSLLTYDEVNTFLHEFGHALHGMLARGKYQSLTGTSVYRDFVELPSQIMENWLPEEAFLKTFALHFQTGNVIPPELVAKIRESEKFLSGYLTLRQLGFGMTDMAWHSLEEPFIGNLTRFEEQILSATDVLPKVEGTLFSPSFSHIFQGGYAAGYYGYKWAEVLDADAFSLFQEKGLFNKEVASSFRTHILEKGGSEHPMVLYRRFRGQEPSIEPFLKRSGLL